MKKVLLFLVAFIVFVGYVPLSHAEGDFRSWLKTMVVKFERISEKKKTKTPTQSVAGVKGAAESAEDELYWKGDESKLTNEEIALFNKGLKQLSEGKNKEGKKTLKGFVKKYPESPLADDAKEGLAYIK